MAFSTRRGRPPKPEAHYHDPGTPELIFKRLHSTTAEAADICLERGIIDNEQHWCILHLRWLHTLRHGTVNVRAVDLTSVNGRDNVSDDLEWRADREREYADAVQALRRMGQDTLVISLAVYDHRPHFLFLTSSSRAPGNLARADRAMQDIDRLRRALDMLCRLWNRKRATT